MNKKQKEEAKREAKEFLLKFLKPGDDVYVKINSVASSGMSRHMDLYVLGIGDNGKPFIQWITRPVATLTGNRFDMKKEDLVIGGCGMDMGFHVVYSLARALFQEFVCIGEDCRANDHSNGDRERTPHKHSDTGYSLNKRSL